MILVGTHADARLDRSSEKEGLVSVRETRNLCSKGWNQGKQDLTYIECDAREPGTTEVILSQVSVLQCASIFYAEYIDNAK